MADYLHDTQETSGVKEPKRHAIGGHRANDPTAKAQEVMYDAWVFMRESSRLAEEPPPYYLKRRFTVILPNWNDKAELHRLEPMESEPRLSPKYLQGRDASFVALVKEVMEMPRAADRQQYSIMVGEDIYLYAQIEEIYNLPDFPKS